MKSLNFSLPTCYNAPQSDVRVPNSNDKVSSEVTFQTLFPNPEEKISLSTCDYNSLIYQGEPTLRKLKSVCLLLTTATQVTAHNRDSMLQYTRYSQYTRYYINANAKKQEWTKIGIFIQYNSA